MCEKKKCYMKFFTKDVDFNQQLQSHAAVSNGLYFNVRHKSWLTILRRSDLVHAGLKCLWAAAFVGWFRFSFVEMLTWFKINFTFSFDDR